ncbi:hypothetical protein HDU86_001776 [Geranomyces michiganensis]|nr:hypothetical protein HDU86_001776 [Geranomyces michiganensis]
MRGDIYILYTELFLPMSDLDVVIHCPPPKAEIGHDSTYGDPDREYSLACLQRLEEALSQSNLTSPFENTRIIDATVPVLKFNEKYTRIPIDISANNADGKESSALIRGWIREYPPLKPVAMYLKHYLYCEGRNETYKGGFGSFLLINLLVFMIKQYQNLLQGPDVCGWLFLSFLHYYGSVFNYALWGVSAKTGKPFELSTDNRRWVRKRRLAFPPALLVEDPTNPNHDMSRGGAHVAIMAQKFREDLLRLQDIFSTSPMPAKGTVLKRWLGPVGEEIEAGYVVRRRSIVDFDRGTRAVHTFP